MPTAGATTPVKGQRKTKVGRVVSDKMDKTIVVSVERLTRHRLYKRVMKASTKFAAHDERNEAKIGDTVLIEESRPLSATKRWRLVSVLSRAGEERAAQGAIVAEEPETTEAIHAAAHPGKTAEADDAGEEGQA
jgi:small subunit ribosomal protein S17